MLTLQRALLFFYLGLVVGLVAACDQTAEPQNNIGGLKASLTPNNVKHASISVIDFAGNTISLDSPAKRIVALAPHIVENVYTAGAGAQLVGRVSYSDFPEEAKKLPIVGGYAKTNLEKILELNPDLVIAWESGNSDASVAKIRELGYPVYIDQPDTLDDLAKSVRDIGHLSGHFEHADKEMQNYLNSLNSFKELNQKKRKVSAFYQVWNSPLQTINGKHIISDAIKVCGGENIYSKEKAIAPIINIESILERDPEVIIASGMSDSRPDWLEDWKQWPTLTAVRRNNLFYVNPDHIQRHSVRVLQGIRSLCAQLDIARINQRHEAESPSE